GSSSGRTRSHGCSLRFLERRRAREPRDPQDLLLVERLAIDEGFGEEVELRTVCPQEALRLRVALVDDSAHFGVDGSRGGFAERPFTYQASTVASSPGQVWVLGGRELDGSELVAHPPARDHHPRDVRGLLDIALGTGCSRTVDDLLGRPPTEHPDDPCAQIRL